MAGFTKQDFDDAYSFRVERYLDGHPNTRAEVRTHYHRWAMVPLLQARWAILQPILNILSTDFVCVVGAGFGWGVEAIIAETGALTVGVDISDYVAAEKDSTEEAELRAEVSAVGLDPDTGRGLEIMNFIFDGSVRSNVVVLQSDAASGPQRTAIRNALGGNWPSVVIAEDVIDDTWTDAEIVSMRNSMNGFGGRQRLIFVYTATEARSAQDLFDVLNVLQGTPSEIISRDGQVYII